MAEQRIVYGWWDGDHDDWARVYHVECRPDPPFGDGWLDNEADASFAVKIDGKGHRGCQGCFGLLAEPPKVTRYMQDVPWGSRP